MLVTDKALSTYNPSMLQLMLNIKAGCCIPNSGETGNFCKGEITGQGLEGYCFDATNSAQLGYCQNVVKGNSQTEIIDSNCATYVKVVSVAVICGSANLCSRVVVSTSLRCPPIEARGPLCGRPNFSFPVLQVVAIQS